MGMCVMYGREGRLMGMCVMYGREGRLMGICIMYGREGRLMEMCVMCDREGRLMGMLEVSRSLGDGALKKHGLSCLPDVKRCQLTEDDR
jgi:hypothetical protein